MATLRSVVTSALRLLNAIQAGEAPSDDDIDIGVEALNGILDSWSTERLFIYSIKPHVFELTAGQASYTLGPDGDFDVPRPLTIQHATFTPDVTTSGTFELPLQLMTTEQYAMLTMKEMSTGYPQGIYDNGDSPLRTLTFWPVPNRATALTLWLWSPLLETTDLDEEFTLPPGYERALRFTLAIELASEFGKDITPSMQQIATSAVAKIKVLNSATNPPIMRPNNSLGTGYGWNYITGGF